MGSSSPKRAPSSQSAAAAQLRRRPPPRLHLARPPPSRLLCAALLLLSTLLLLRLLLRGERDGAEPLSPRAAQTSPTAHLRARELLLHRNSTRLVFLVDSQARAARAHALTPSRRRQETQRRLCALARAAGELVACAAEEGPLRSVHPSRVASAPPGRSATPPAQQCRALRGAAASALVLLRPGFAAAAAAADGDEEGWLPFFDARALHVAVVDAPTPPRGARRALRIRTGARESGGSGGAGEASGEAAAAALAAAAVRLRRYDAALTSDALGEGLAGLAPLTRWPQPVGPGAGPGPGPGPGEALQALSARLLARAPAAHPDAWAAHAAAAQLAAAGPQPRARAKHRFCSTLPGPPAAPGLPPGAGWDGDGLQAPTTPPVWRGDPPLHAVQVALCAAVRDAAPFLDEWLHFHLSAGVARAYVHADGSRSGEGKDGGTAAALRAWGAEGVGFVTPLAPLHGQTRFGVAERSRAGGWSGQREVLGRCLTHALLDGMDWLMSCDLDEFAMPRRPSPSLGQALQAMSVASCVTVRRHAFNSNNASARAAPPPPARDGGGAAAAAAGGVGGGGLPLPRSRITRTFLRRDSTFPPDAPGTPRNPRWALNLRLAAGALRERGPHAVAPQVHNVWDRSSCQRCLQLPQLLQAGLTPEVDGCAGELAELRNASEAGAAEAACARNVCAGGSGGVEGEAALRVHHYVLPQGAKSYRRGGKGDRGARRDVWEGDVEDAEALRFSIGEV